MSPQVVHAPHKCAPALLTMGCCALCDVAAFHQAAGWLSLLSLVVMAAGSMLADAALVTCRAPPEVRGMSTPAACQLLSQYVPATAALFAEFRRLRDGLPPADAREFAELLQCSQGVLGHAAMMTEVRLCACPMLLPEACRAAELKPGTCAMNMCRTYGLTVVKACARQHPTSRNQTSRPCHIGLMPDMLGAGADAEGLSSGWGDAWSSASGLMCRLR